MSEKNLDKMFYEKLKDFSEVPDEKVWQGISAALDKKKKRRRIIPLWWKLGGVAAILAVAFYIFNPFTDGIIETPVITNVEKQDDLESKQEIDARQNDLDNQKEGVDALVDGEPPLQKTVEVDKAATPNDSNATLRQDKTKESTISVDFESPKTTGVAENNTQNNILRKDSAVQAEEVNPITQNQDESVALIENEAIQNHQEKKANEETGLANRKSIPQVEQNTIEDEGLAQLEEEQAKDEVDSANQKSIFDEIKAQESEEFEVAENNAPKWSVGANVAPVYFNAIGEGSPIHSSFVPNSKSGDVNLSYGLTVAYSISKKLSVRSGIHKVDYGYNTNDVEFSSSFELSANGQIQNIDYTVTSENVFVSSKTSANALRENVAFDAANQETSRDGVIAQQFGYLEIPVELNYALIDKRFGINLVGGLSSLFLTDNSVELSSGQLTTEIGKANNINAVNFSANAGFGVNYKISPKVQLNVEPVFKYQLNTFSNDAGSFQPFSIGVYSGLNLRF